jgi:N-acetyl-gamma-glutamyl-phosphate reductase
MFYKLEHTAPGLLGEAVYGLPELHRDEIRKASLVANPGCYPTSIILALAPLAKGSLLDQSFPPIADSKSGVSGAGKRSEAGYSFTELNDNFKAYKLVGHQHTPEAAQELSLLQNAPLRLSFTPHLAPMSRGILSTVYCRLSSEKSAQELIGLYKDFYRGSPFVRVRGEDPPAVLDVRGTNFCDLAVFHDKEAGLYKIVSAIDNLARGSSVQAAVNLNLMAGKPEDFAMPMTPFRP